jgi:hypothetical protein
VQAKHELDDTLMTPTAGKAETSIGMAGVSTDDRSSTTDEKAAAASARGESLVESLCLMKDCFLSLNTISTLLSASLLLP